ncbi:MAG: hypothetical protein ABII23_02195 [bacterium]
MNSLLYVNRHFKGISSKDLFYGWNFFFLLFFSTVYLCAFLTSTLGKFGSENMLKSGIYSAVIFIASMLFFVKGSKRLKQKRMIEDIPTSKIKSMALGLVEIKGNILKTVDIKTPYSYTACVYYYFIKERYDRSSKGGGSWRVVNQGRSKQPFYIDDGSGKILVDPRDIDLAGGPRYVNYPGFLRDERVKEWYLLNNEEVYLIGTACKARDFMQEFDILVTQELRNLKKDAERLNMFDTNKDGVIDAEEWDKAAQFIKQTMKEKQIHKLQDIPHADVAIKRDAEHDLFIISKLSEKVLISRLLWRGIGSIILSLALFCGSVVMLMPEFLAEYF